MRGRRRRGDERVCGDAGGGGSAAGGAGRGAHPAVSVQGHRLGPRAHAHPGVALESVHFPAPPGREVCPPGHAQAVAGGGGGEGAAARLQHRRPQEHLLTLNAAIGSTDVSLLRLSLLCWRHHCWRYHCCAGEGAVSRLRLAFRRSPVHEVRAAMNGAESEPASAGAAGCGAVAPLRATLAPEKNGQLQNTARFASELACRRRRWWRRSNTRTPAAGTVIRV